MARPLMQHGVGQLEELFAKSKSDQQVLKQLEFELQYRQVPRAVALLAEVQAAMYGLSPAPAPATAAEAPAAPTAPSPQPSLWDNPSPPASRPRAPAPTVLATPTAARPVIAPAPATIATPPVPVMPLEDAYKLLKATPGSTWESIEQTRRLLVRASHPEKFRGASEGKRSQALAEASRVNAAYAMLSRARCVRDGTASRGA
jgi:DnaJ-domain-containing protein 1